MIGGVPIIRRALATGLVTGRGALALHVEALERYEDFVAEREQLAPERGRLDAAIPHLRDRAAHRVGELADEAGHRGLRERQLLGGARHAAMAYARLECDQLRKHAVTKISSKADTGHGALHAVRHSSRAVLLEFSLGNRRGLCPKRDEGRKQKDLCHARQRSG